jgi:alkylhydroperoxidase/carboxymuconolactone decarboxylase family protein YurZ
MPPRKQVSLLETEPSPRVSIFTESFFFFALGKEIFRREPHKKLSAKKKHLVKISSSLALDKENLKYHFLASKLFLSSTCTYKKDMFKFEAI